MKFHLIASFFWPDIEGGGVGHHRRSRLMDGSTSLFKGDSSTATSSDYAKKMMVTDPADRSHHSASTAYTVAGKHFVPPIFEILVPPLNSNVLVPLAQGLTHL